jgi:hypothetical protein
LLVDIPTEDRFSSYTCLLYSPSGSLSWRVEVSPQQAKDTVSIRVPSAGQGVRGVHPDGAGQYGRECRRSGALSVYLKTAKIKFLRNEEHHARQMPRRSFTSMQMRIRSAGSLKNRFRK